MKYLLLLVFGLSLAAAVESKPFKLVIKTNNPGGTAANTFALPLLEGHFYDFTIAWGDGKIEDYFGVGDALPVTRIYSTAGTKTIQITDNRPSGFPGVCFGRGGDATKVLQLSQWGDGTWTSFFQAFMGCANMTITATDSATAQTDTVTDFSSAWSGCKSMTSFPLIKTSSGVNFNAAWKDCSALTSFPLINTPNGIHFDAAWSECRGLTNFPLLNTSSGTYFQTTWSGCSALTSFPLLDMSKGYSFYYTWSNCEGLTSFPLINTTSAVELSGAWFNCKNLAGFPAINTSNTKYFDSAWSGCEKLTAFPLINTSNAVVIGGAWSGCKSLTSFPLIDTSNITGFSYTWELCQGLTSFPQLNTSKGIAFQRTWAGCSALTDFPLLDLSRLSRGDQCFNGVTLSSDIYSNLLLSLASKNNNRDVTFEGGFSRYHLSAANARNTTLIANRGWNIIDGGVAPPVITSPVAANAVIGQSFTYAITATNAATSFNATGLPGGLAVNTSTGAITGTASGPVGLTTVTLSATNTTGTTNRSLTLSVNNAGAPAITSKKTAAGTIGVAFSYQIVASQAPTSFNAVGLPDGLTIDTATGLISGTPTEDGVTAVVLHAINANGTGVGSLSITIVDPAAVGGGGSTGGAGGGGGGCGLGGGTAAGLLLGGMLLLNGPGFRRRRQASSTSRGR